MKYNFKLIFFINERNTSNNISCDVADKKEEVIKTSSYIFKYHL